MIDGSNDNEIDTKIISKYLLSNAIMYMSMAPDPLEIVCLGTWKNDHTPTPLFSPLLCLPPTPSPFRNFLAYNYSNVASHHTTVPELRSPWCVEFPHHKPGHSAQVDH